jgi:hypothetical protein
MNPMNTPELEAAAAALRQHERVCETCQYAIDGHGRCANGERIWQRLLRWNAGSR